MDEPMAFILSNLPGLVALVIAFMLGTAVEQYRVKARRAEWRAKNGWKFRKKKPVTRADFAAGQLKTVSQAPFTSRPLLNKSEANVFTALDKAVIARNPGWQVMAQVSLGEFLASPDKNAFLSVNSKRIDFALMDDRCCVVHALEYQGSGHHVGNCAPARDAVKKEALRKAGIGYHEVVAGHTTAGELRALVEKLVPVG
ncbi:DUF2726 domain-containing protein [uncultured Parasphingorhabdus sp.]|uniref:DUF2726 domain-containing protein n=1 Tax=uncultured Parasphingorhabdus sp. TaxID=2709694 RepID=UPI0030DAD5DC|tara:strand:- start:57573 stop:58169 length:597 start_codon:yes stop_codon:yes gene_type:complete